MPAVPPHNSNCGHYPELQGFSADGSHAVFRIEDSLTPDAAKVVAEPPNYQLYESYSEGESPRQLRLVSVLPSKAPAEKGASAGVAGIGSSSPQRLDTLTHAISDDGTRIYWTAANAGPGKIYLRLNGEKTLPVSEGIDPSPARFWAASADGSKALYSFESGPKSGDLYLYDLESKASALVVHKFLGLLGGGDDLSHFYILSQEALGEGAVAGKPNLYLNAEGTLSYIAQLSPADARIGDQHLTPVNSQPYWHAARATPDGGSLAFMSTSRELSESVGGADNTDRVSGAPDAEVYHYSVATDRLSCVSCNPTGSRPAGRFLSEDVSDGTLSVAALIPASDSQLYQPRYLSDDGSRLFFDSFESLLPNDTNGARDVYEWEAPGSGSCTEGSAAFSPPNGGCVALISTGESPRDSELIDASADGRDVFILTLSSLVPQDPGLVDIYDVRSSGGFPAPPNRAPVCEGEACQGPLSPPNDPTPASSSFEGAGNVGKQPARQHKKAKKRKGKKHKRGKHDRAKHTTRRAGR